MLMLWNKIKGFNLTEGVMSALVGPLDTQMYTNEYTY